MSTDLKKQINELTVENELLKRQLDDLQHSNESAIEILKNAPVFVSILNAKGNIIYMNRSFSDTAINDYIDKHFLLFVSADDRIKVNQVFQDVMKNGKTESYDCRIVEKKELALSCFMSRFQLQNVDHAVVFSSDISARKSAEEALRSSEAKYKYIVEEATDAIFIFNKYSKLVDVNLTACELFGYEKEVFLGKRLFEFIPRDKIDRIPHLVPEIYRGHTVGEEIELERSDGTKFTVDAKVRRLPNGKIIAFLRDISKKLEKQELQKDAELKIQQSKRLESLGVLAGGMAHEFNNILTPILGYSELLLAESKNDANSSKNIKQIVNGANRAKELVEQILVFSRKDNQSKSPLEIHIVLKEAMKLLRSSIPSSVQIIEQIEACPAINANPAQIHQVITQLCSNAYNALTKQKGEIQICLRVTKLKETLETQYSSILAGDYILLSVEDNGKGIEKSIIDRIFDPFFTTNEIGEGSGMGLSIVHGIIKAHSGTIRIESEKGKGTHFQIYFPLESVVKEKKEVRALPSQDLDKKQGGHILIVDDEIEVVNLFEILLKRKGFSITKFTSSTEALEKIEKNAAEYDLMISDQTMPDLVGTELAKKTRLIRKDLPILLLTGYSDLISPENFHEYGIDDILIKPIVPKVFYEKIFHILEKYQSIS